MRSSCRREERALRDVHWSFVDAETKLRALDPLAAAWIDTYDGTKVERTLLRRVRALQAFQVRTASAAWT